MSDDTDNGSLTELPEVVLVYFGHSKLIQDYENLTVVAAGLEDSPNDFIEPGKYQIFMGYKYDFTTESAISTLMKPMLNDKCVKAAYADAPQQYYPSYDYNYFNPHTQLSVLFNVPLLFKSSENIKFKSIELYYHEFFHRFAQTNFVYHVAKELIKVSDTNVTTTHIQELQKCLEQPVT